MNNLSPTGLLKTLYIVEPDATGHRMVYVRRIVREAVARGIKAVVVTLPEFADHKSIDLMNSELAGRYELALLDPGPLERALLSSTNLFFTQLGYYLAFRSFFSGSEINGEGNAVFIPYIDHCDKMISLFGSPFGPLPWSGLSMQFKFHVGRMGAVRPAERGDFAKERGFVSLLKNKTLKKLFVIDELLAEYTKQQYGPLSDKLSYVGDPVDMKGSISSENSRKLFGLPIDKKVVLIFGALEMRKGVSELIAASVMESFPSNTVLFFAGRQGDSIKALMSGEPVESLRKEGRLIEVDRFLDDEEEYAAFMASDIVWVAYRQFYGMSGVLVQAGAAGLPIVASNVGLIGHLTRKYGLGVAVDIESPDQVSGAFAELVNNPARRKQLGNQGRLMAARHSSEEFSKSIIDSFMPPGRSGANISL